jgi:hypothetical protein
MGDQKGQTHNPPKAGRVIGILNIIFGSFGTFSGLVSILVFSVINSIFRGFSPQYPYEFQALAAAMQNLFVIVIILTFIQFGINIVALAGGIGLVRKRHWGILVSNIYAGATIALSFTVYFIVRHMMEMLLSSPSIVSTIPQEELFILDTLKNIVPGIAGVTSILFGSAYPVLVLILINRAKVRNYYAAIRDEEAAAAGGAAEQ